MSIIQEALKKAQYNYVKKTVISPIGRVRKTSEKISDKNKAFHKIHSNAFLIIGGLVIFVLFIGVGLRYSLFNRTAVPIKEQATVNIKSEPKEINDTPDDTQKNIAATKSLIFSTAILDKTPDFILNGIMYLSDRPKAIINSRVVQEGDYVDGAVVKTISRDNVSLVFNDKDIKIRLQ